MDTESKGISYRFRAAHDLEPQELSGHHVHHRIAQKVINYKGWRFL
jgi:hypothetical protein